VLLLDQEGRRVNAEPGHSQFQPEPHDGAHLVADGRGLEVEIGLTGVEVMQVVGARLVVEGPDAVLLPRKNDPVAGIAGVVFAPDVVVAVSALPVAPGCLEPGCSREV
jgi:hypothetical protein